MHSLMHKGALRMPGPACVSNRMLCHYFKAVRMCQLHTRTLDRRQRCFVSAIHHGIVSQFKKEGGPTRLRISSNVLRRFVTGGISSHNPHRANGKAEFVEKLNVVDFDEFGSPQLKSIPKRELRHSFDLTRRFLKIIDGSMVNRHPLITVNSQGTAIIVSLDYTARVIILRDRVVLPDPRTTAGERLCVLLKRALERSPSDPEAFNLIDGSLTDESNRYELRALEAVLKFVAGGLENQFRVLAGAVNTVLHDLSQGASEEALQRLIPLKLALSAFGVQVKEFKESVNDVVDDPKSLYKLDLTTRDPTDAASHDDGANENAVETAHNLLDHYYYIADEIYNETEQLIQDIRGTEEVLAISLDKSRNQLINLNLFATAGAFVAGCGSFLASIFGMNLHVEDVTESWSLTMTDGATVPSFALVCCGITGLSTLVGISCYRWFYDAHKAGGANVVAQAVMDKLFVHAEVIESFLMTHNYFSGSQSAMTREQFSDAMVQLRMQISPQEIDALFAQYRRDDKKIPLDLFVSMLYQRKRSHRSRVRVGQDANTVDIMPPHVPITGMHLPSQRSGNDFFTI